MEIFTKYIFENDENNRENLYGISRITRRNYINSCPCHTDFMKNDHVTQIITARNKCIMTRAQLTQVP